MHCANFPRHLAFNHPLPGRPSRWRRHKIGEAVLCVEDDPSKIKWALPKKPYQFIAACVELIQALDKGSDFITRLPLTFDASCSGLQHLCAMTRADEGRYVNLVPNDDGDDFYRRVAFKVSENAEAARCMDGRFDRAIVKQPAMSYFYGSRKGGFTKNRAGRFRPYGMTKQVAAVLDGREDKAPKAAQLIAHEIYNSVEGMVPKAEEVRDFLEGLAMICAEMAYLFAGQRRSVCLSSTAITNRRSRSSRFLSRGVAGVQSLRLGTNPASLRKKQQTRLRRISSIQSTPPTYSLSRLPLIEKELIWSRCMIVSARLHRKPRV
jgi:hypothetical protein